MGFFTRVLLRAIMTNLGPVSRSLLGASSATQSQANFNTEGHKAFTSHYSVARTPRQDSLYLIPQMRDLDCLGIDIGHTIPYGLRDPKSAYIGNKLIAPVLIRMASLERHQPSAVLWRCCASKSTFLSRSGMQKRIIL